jgi:hypothetical protein
MEALVNQHPGRLLNDRGFVRTVVLIEDAVLQTVHGAAARSILSPYDLDPEVGAVGENVEPTTITVPTRHRRLVFGLLRL